MKYAEVQNCIGGAFVSPDGPTLDVYDPSIGRVISRVPLSSARDVDAAVSAARAAFPAWSSRPIKERVQVLYRYKALLERHIDELSALVTEENGKIASEARAEVLKSAELTEFACSLPQIVTGEVLEVSRGVECRIERYPVGVVASITPFNFPNMVPNWSIPNAIALGNCMILKPSEMVPGKGIGPVISAAGKERISRYIDEAEAAGAKVIVDGRKAVVAGREGGYYLGPTIIDRVTPDMKIAQEEVFGPVLVIVRTANVDEALKVENASPYGNAASVFTESGGVARYVMERASAGMVGVNVGVPVPREPFSFGGWNESKFGVGDITGRGSIEFLTQAEEMTTEWDREA